MTWTKYLRKLKCNVDEKNGMWKGNDVTYHSLHYWVRARMPKPTPDLCSMCKSVPSHDLANISGKYIRDLNDWHWICRRCHMLSDGRMNNLKQYQEVVRDQQQ